jgi:hypothetical protein|tara:strand:- start:362 stop:751 length:390 start_codon:yes stop_codon:yes gene_type:complete
MPLLNKKDYSIVERDGLFVVYEKIEGEDGSYTNKKVETYNTEKDAEDSIKSKRELKKEDRKERREEKVEERRSYRLERLSAIKDKLYAVAAKRKWLFFIIAGAIVAYLVIFKGGFGGGDILNKIKGFFG